MYFLDVSEINAVLGGGVNPSAACGPERIHHFHDVLMSITTRMQGLLEVETFNLTSITDYFKIDRAGDVKLRFSGAFLVPGSEVIFTGPRGEALSTSGFDIDHRLGVAEASLAKGRHTVTYTQGLPVNEAHVFQCPEFLKTIAKYVAVRHYRVSGKLGSIPEHISLDDVTRAADSDVWRNVTKSWHRPRYGVVDPYRWVDNGPA